MEEGKENKSNLTDSTNFRLPSIHISKAVERSIHEIDKRRAGHSPGLKTRWNKLNKIIGGGIQWGSNYIIASISGVGKSSIANLMETDLFDLNPDEKFIVLNFNFEMHSYKQIIRKYTTKIKKSMNEIMDSENPITDTDYNSILRHKESISRYNIYYIDVPGNITEIYKTILSFQKEFPNHHLLNFFDHTRLVNSENEGTEIERTTRLSKMGMVLKKKIDCTNIFLSQLNSNIENPSRLSTPSLHKPMRSDIFGSGAMYQDADTVFMPHRPELLGIEYYMPAKIPTQDLLAFHLEKNRDGPTGYIKMRCNLAHNVVEEYDEPHVYNKEEQEKNEMLNRIDFSKIA